MGHRLRHQHISIQRRPRIEWPLLAATRSRPLQPTSTETRLVRSPKRQPTCASMACCHQSQRWIQQRSPRSKSANTWRSRQITSTRSATSLEWRSSSSFHSGVTTSKSLRTWTDWAQDWSSCAGIEKLRVLKVLFISNNKISDFKEVNRLAKLSSTLEEVVLFGNPLHMGIIGKDGELAWADQVLTALPTLKKLDGISAVDWRNKMDSGNEKELRDVFQLIDADGGGTLDQDELKFAVKDPKVAEMMGLDPVEIEFILVKILNSKGPDEEVTFEDFCYWFSNDQK